MKLKSKSRTILRREEAHDKVGVKVPDQDGLGCFAVKRLRGLPEKEPSHFLLGVLS